jgi:twitching motility protein PilT
MASLIDYINKNSSKHIVTIEDPIEYMFENENSIIEQREV